MSKQPSQILVRDIDHLGIIAGIIDEIGLEEEINDWSLDYAMTK